MRRDGTTFTAEFTVQHVGEEEETARGLAAAHAAAGVDGGPLDGTVVVLRDASDMGETVRKLRVRVAELEAAMQRLVEMAKPPSS